MTKRELEELINEFIDARNNAIDESEDMMMEDFEVICTEAVVFISQQGKNLKKQIKDIINENIEKLGIKDSIRRYFLADQILLNLLK